MFDFQIEKNFYHIDMSEYTWWSFDEGSGYTIYDAAGSRHGTIVGSNNFVSGKVGSTAFEFDPTFNIPSQFSIEKGNVEYQGDFNWIDSNYTSAISDGPYSFVPAQPSNFTLVNGTSDWSGDMYLVDNNYTTFIGQGPYPIQSTGYVFPDGDILTGWNEGFFPPHWDKLKQTGIAIADTGSEHSPGIVDRQHYGSIAIQDGWVTQLKVHVYGKEDSGTTAHCAIVIRVDGSSSSSLYPNFDSYYSWKDVTWSGLELTQAQLESLTVELRAWNAPDYLREPGKVYVDKVYVEVTYCELFNITHVESKIPLDSDVIYSDDVELLYSYKTNITQSIDFKIFNYYTSQWDLIDSSSYPSFSEHSFNLDSNYYNQDHEIYLKFFGKNAANSFKLQVDQLKVYCKNHTIDFNVTISSSNFLGDIKLLYAHRTNITQSIRIEIWNDDLKQWDFIDNSTYLSFIENYFNITDKYQDENYDVLLRFYGTNSFSSFVLDIDLLKICEYSYIETPVVFNTDQDPFSLSVWIYAYNLDDTGTIYGEYSSSSVRNYVAVQTDGSVIFDQNLPSGGAAVSDAGLITEDEWIQLSITKLDNQVTFYKNGVPFGDPIWHNETYAGSTPIKAGIGARYGNLSWHHDLFDGRIDDLRLFKDSLIWGAVKLLYNNSFGTNMSLQQANYDGFYRYNDKIFPLSTNLFLNLTSTYSNIHGVPYYNTLPKIVFNGQNYGNQYEVQFHLNVPSENIANLSLEATRSMSGAQVLRIDLVPGGMAEITRLFVTSESTDPRVIDSNEIFYYFGISNVNRTLFIQFSDDFIESTFFNVTIEYKYSSNIEDNFPFMVEYDISNFVSDIYNVEIIAYDIHNTRVTRRDNV
ncbi:hypothetical protein ES703_04634 [subsurface metagenome]